MLALAYTGRPGWVEVVEPGLPARIWINVIEKEGRHLVGTMLVNGEPLDAAALKRIPMSRIEALLNQHGAEVGAAIRSPEVTQSVADAAQGVAAAQGEGRYLKSWSAEFAGIEEALERLLASPPPPPRQQGPAPDREPLQRPDGSDPEGFYRQVAAAYSALIGSTSRPAKALAEEAEVPVATVHRWIHEARRRGLLPPARKGRAG